MLDFSLVLFMLTCIFIAWLIYYTVRSAGQKKEKHADSSSETHPSIPSSDSCSAGHDLISTQATLLAKFPRYSSKYAFSVDLLFLTDDHERIAVYLKVYDTIFFVPGDRGILTCKSCPPKKDGQSPTVDFVSFVPEHSIIESLSAALTALQAAPCAASSAIHSTDTTAAPVVSTPAVIIRLTGSDSSALFELPNGERRCFVIPASTFLFLREGLSGQLSYQGDTFSLFTPDSSL